MDGDDGSLPRPRSARCWRISGSGVIFDWAVVPPCQEDKHRGGKNHHPDGYEHNHSPSSLLACRSHSRRYDRTVRWTGLDPTRPRPQLLAAAQVLTRRAPGARGERLHVQRHHPHYDRGEHGQDERDHDAPGHPARRRQSSRSRPRESGSARARPRRGPASRPVRRTGIRLSDALRCGEAADWHGCPP